MACWSFSASSQGHSSSSNRWTAAWIRYGPSESRSHTIRKPRFDAAVLQQHEVAAAQCLVQSHQQRTATADVMCERKLREPTAPLVHSPDSDRQIFYLPGLAASLHGVAADLVGDRHLNLRPETPRP